MGCDFAYQNAQEEFAQVENIIKKKNQTTLCLMGGGGGNLFEILSTKILHLHLFFFSNAYKFRRKYNQSTQKGKQH
jgi:hypothetical protein